MASRGYNGILAHVIKDITRSDEYHTLINAGENWQCLSKRETVSSIHNQMDTIEERDVYRQWYHMFLLEELLLDEEESTDA